MFYFISLFFCLMYHLAVFCVFRPRLVNTVYSLFIQQASKQTNKKHELDACMLALLFLLFRLLIHLLRADFCLSRFCPCVFPCDLPLLYYLLVWADHSYINYSMLVGLIYKIQTNILIRTSYPTNRM